MNYEWVTSLICTRNFCIITEHKQHSWRFESSLLSSSGENIVKFTRYMHRCARIFCRNTNTFTHQWNKWAPFNVLITDNFIFMAQGALLVEHFLYHHPSSTSSLSHGIILPNTLLPHVLKICSFSGVKHYVTLIKQAVDVELLNRPPTTIKTFLTHPK